MLAYAEQFTNLNFGYLYKCVALCVYGEYA
jgi:hypothetical protein